MHLKGGYSGTPSANAGAFGGPDEREQLMANAPLVKKIVRQLSMHANGSIGREDMEQIGLMGLLEALRRYGPPDEKFPAFAAMRVRGAILDELRRQDWRPRAVRQQSHRLRDGLRELTRRLGREPEEAEILAAFQLSPEDYARYQVDVNAAQMASFDDVVNELSHIASDHHTPEATLIARRSIEQALRVLDEREQRVIQLYYEFDMSLKEIGAVLGVTEARVCQLNRAALRKMHSVLEPCSTKEIQKEVLCSNC